MITLQINIVWGGVTGVLKLIAMDRNVDRCAIVKKWPCAQGHLAGIVEYCSFSKNQTEQKFMSAWLHLC